VRQLVIVTCDDYNRVTGYYQKNVFAVAEPVVPDLVPAQTAY